MRIKFFNHLVLCALGAGLLFTSCKKDDDEVSGDPAIKVANTTWGVNSGTDVTAGITLKFSGSTFVYTVVNYDGATEISRGTFATIPPYDVVLRQEDGTSFARGIEKEGTLELELFDLSGMAGITLPPFQNHAYLAYPTTSSNASKFVTLFSGVQGGYAAVPGGLSIKVSNDSLGEAGAGNAWAEVTLSWSAVEGATSYRVFRAVSPDDYKNTYFTAFRTIGANPTAGGGLTFAYYADVTGGKTSIEMPKESARTEYNYYVAAYNGQTPLGAPAFAYKPGNQAVTAPTNLDYLVTGNQIILSWNKDFLKSSYRIYQIAQNGNRIIVADVAANTDFSAARESYTVTTDALKGSAFVSGETYTYAITGFNAIGIESPIAAGNTQITSFFDQVTGFRIAFDKDGNKMLYWNKVLYTPAAGYKIYNMTNADTIALTTVAASVDNEIAVSGLGLDYSMPYNLSISASAKGQFSSILSAVTYFPAPVAAQVAGISVTPSAVETSTDTVMIKWEEINTLDVTADSYTISYQYVDTNTQVANIAEYGEIQWDFTKAVALTAVTKTSATAAVDNVWYDKNVANGFEYEFYITNTNNAIGKYGQYRFWIQATGNGTNSDAILLGTIVHEAR